MHENYRYASRVPAIPTGGTALSPFGTRRHQALMPIHKSAFADICNQADSPNRPTTFCFVTELFLGNSYLEYRNVICIGQNCVNLEIAVQHFYYVSD
jgi:hypothetical protein